MSPEMAVSPVQQAPPDRPTADLETALRQVEAIIYADRKLDEREQRILYDFMENMAVRATNGGVGTGLTRPPEQGGPPPGPSAMEMNQNVQDFGTVEGAEPLNGYGEEEGGGY
jgi:hypothetical protein